MYKVRTPAHPPLRKGISFKKTKSRAKQAFAKEADINNIMARYVKTGVMPSDGRKGTYGDFSNGDDFRSVCDRVLLAEGEFNSLPAELRKRFNNNPAMLLDFLANPANTDEAIQLGLLPPPPVEVTPKPQAEESAAETEEGGDSL